MAIVKRIASEGYVDEKALYEANKAVENLPQADWNQNDEAAIDFIKNRPFYEETGVTSIVLFDGDVELLVLFPDGGTPEAQWGEPLTFENGKIYTVAIEDEQQDIVCENNELIFISSTLSDTYALSADGIFSRDGSGPEGTYHIKIETTEISRNLEQLDEKYIPDTIARKEYVNEAIANADFVPTPATATVGQLLAVKTADENGKPIEWETVDAPSGEGSGNSVELDSTLTEEGKAADAKVVGDALNGKLSKSGGTMSGKIVFPTADQNVGFTNSEDMKIFGYGTVNGATHMRIGDTAYPFQIRGNGVRPKYNDDELVLKSELDAIMGAYITDIDTLIGGDA